MTVSITAATRVIDDNTSAPLLDTVRSWSIETHSA
jgi:hypothetical protein